MENSKDKGSRSSSKVNLNESNVPLLEEEAASIKGGESKVTIEMDSKSGDEKTQADGKESKEKKKKEKSHKRTISLAERLTAGLNLLDRDDRRVNDHINIVFEDVLAEPDSDHGFDSIWGLAFLVFSGTKLWVYRIISAFLAIPCGILWGFLFSILTLLNIWLITPMLRTFDVLMHILHRVWSSVVRTFLDPVFQSMGQLCSNITINATRQNV